MSVCYFEVTAVSLGKMRGKFINSILWDFFLTHYCLSEILERVQVANNQILVLKTKYVLSFVSWEFFCP